MANTVSAKKMTRKIAKRTAVNRSRRSRMRTFIRKVEEAIEAGNHGDAMTALRSAEPEIMRASRRGSCTRTPRRGRSRASPPA